LVVRCAEVDASWLLRLGEHGVTTTPATGSDLDRAQCTVSGPAGDLYLALWNRAGSDHLAVAGERSVLDRFSEAVRIR
jgi:hypothetical protein